MSGTAVFFFICVFGLLIAFSVWLDFMLWLLIGFAAVLVIFMGVLFSSDDVSTPRDDLRINTRYNPTKFENNLRSRIEDEYYNSKFGGPEDLR